jgi:hypothetical protein
MYAGATSGTLRPLGNVIMNVAMAQKEATKLLGIPNV